MAITETDLQFKYTNDADETDPETSLGGTCSPNTIPPTANKVYDDVTGQEAEDGRIEYRAIGIHNTLGTHVWMNTKMWITGYDRAGSNFDTMFFANEQPAGTGGEPDGTLQVIASETHTPSGLSWTEEGEPSSTINVDGKDYTGSIGADDWTGIWLMRSVPAGAAAFSDRSVTIKVQGETSASPLRDVGITLVVHWDKDFKVDILEATKANLEVVY